MNSSPRVAKYPDVYHDSGIGVTSVESDAWSFRFVAKSKMLAQIAKTREDQQFPCAALQLGMLQVPCIRVRNENGVEPRLQRRIDVAARAIPHHPAVRFHDLELLHHPFVNTHVLFQHDFNRIEIRLQS